MAVTSLLSLKIAPDKLSDAKRLIDEVLVATRAFDGCLGVDVVVNVTDPADYLLIEHWESLAHDDAYRAWRSDPANAAELPAAEPPVLTRYLDA